MECLEDDLLPDAKEPGHDLPSHGASACSNHEAVDQHEAMLMGAWSLASRHEESLRTAFTRVRDVVAVRLINDPFVDEVQDQSSSKGYILSMYFLANSISSIYD